MVYDYSTRHVENRQPKPNVQTRNISTVLIEEWLSPLLPFKGVQARSLLRRPDVMKILFVCLCLYHICPVGGCGVDPMRYVENYARIKGFDSTEPIISFMKLNTPSDYSKLMKEKSEYIACTRMVHTGYFKRGKETSVNDRQLPVSFLGSGVLLTKQNGGSKLGQLLVPKRAYDSNSYLESDLGTMWLNSGLNGQFGPQATLERLQNQDNSLLQRMKQIGAETLSLGNSYDTAGFYKDGVKRR